MTTAETIAAKHDTDHLTTEELEKECRYAARYVDLHRGHTARYTFRDGSIITIARDEWGPGFADCWCLARTAHTTACERDKRIGVFNG